MDPITANIKEAINAHFAPTLENKIPEMVYPAISLQEETIVLIKMSPFKYFI